MDITQVLRNISERDRKVEEISGINNDLIIDVGALTADSKQNVTLMRAGTQRETAFKEFAKQNVQSILNKLYSLDTEVLDGEKVIRLPEPKTIFPRGKSVPKPKEATKWERFAQKKGIKSKSSNNRDKLLWDNSTNKWVPRFGYKKNQNDEEKNWVIEVPDNADPNVDYFAKRQHDKKERVAKNQYQKLRNVAAASSV